MRLSLWQGPSCEGDIQMAMQTLGAMLTAAGAAGARMLVAPEVYLPGYNQDDIASQAQAQQGECMTHLARLCTAAGCGLCVGYAERDGASIYNAAIVIGPQGETLGHYRKVQLFGSREKAIYLPGDAYCTFQYEGVKAAILICYDIEFDAHVAALAGLGVTLIVVPTANMAPFTHVATATVPAMAANHALSIVYANYCGVEGDLTYIGNSLIAGPDGSVLAQAGQGPVLLVADLPHVDAALLSTQSQDYRKVI